MHIKRLFTLHALKQHPKIIKLYSARQIEAIAELIDTEAFGKSLAKRLNEEEVLSISWDEQAVSSGQHGWAWASYTEPVMVLELYHGEEDQESS